MSRLFDEAQDGLAHVQRLCCANSFSSHKKRLYPAMKLEADIVARGMAIPPCVTARPATFPYERLDDAMKRHLAALMPTAEISVAHVDHEYCHARGAYDFSPYQESLVLTMDGSGDRGIFSRAYIGRDGDLVPIGESSSGSRIVGSGEHRAFSKPCSIGGIFSYFTYLLGFLPNSEEGKLEALAPFGGPCRLFSKYYLTRSKSTGSLTPLNSIRVG